jgi:hemoglobin-like flavoprotein
MGDPVSGRLRARDGPGSDCGTIGRYPGFMTDSPHATDGNGPVMTPSQVRLVQATAGQVTAAAEPIARLAYDRLFSLHPELRSLFNGGLAAQGQKLMATLALVTYHLDDPERFLPALRQLGRRHAGYGVQPEDYRRLGQALVWAAGRTLNGTFTEEVQEAWLAAYDLLAGFMQAAAAEIAYRGGLHYRPENDGA